MSPTQPFPPLPELGIGSANQGGEASVSGEGAPMADYARLEGVALGLVVDVSAMARVIGFTFPVFVTRGAYAEGVMVIGGEPAGTGLHDMLSRAWEAYRFDRRGKEVQDLKFVTRWHGTNQGFVKLKLRLARKDKRTRYATIMRESEE